MDKKHEWQKLWREALGEPTDSMPDIREDYALQFDIWSIGDEKLKECFSIFPNGDLLFNRLMEAIRSHPKSTEVDDQVLLGKLEQMNRSIEIVLNQFGDPIPIERNAEKRKIKKRTVFRGNRTVKREVSRNSDPPTIHLDDELCEITERYCGEEGYEAYFYLAEPLYQMAGCYYTVSRWVLWAMVEREFEVDPYQPGFDLYKMKAHAGWNNEELFVFIEN